VRWLLWIAILGYSLEFLLNRESHLDNFGHLLFSTELIMFGLPLAALFVGFFEMATRERAGVFRNNSPTPR
jgi:hypothetical protein